jgi:hypothetical protein
MDNNKRLPISKSLIIFAPLKEIKIRWGTQYLPARNEDIKRNYEFC